MRILIDIPEEHYRTLQEALKNHMESLIGKIILNGTPIPDNATVCDIEQIRAEIEAARYGLINDGLDVALQIIDKYMKGE